MLYFHRKYRLFTDKMSCITFLWTLLAISCCYNDSVHNIVYIHCITSVITYAEILRNVPACGIVQSLRVFCLLTPSPSEFRHELEFAAMAISNYSWHLGSALIFKRLWVMSRAYGTPRPHDHITFLSDITKICRKRVARSHGTGH